MTVTGELRSIDAITTPLEQTYTEPEVQLPLQVGYVRFYILSLWTTLASSPFFAHLDSSMTN